MDEATVIRVREDVEVTQRTLNEAVGKAIANGHKLVDIQDTDTYAHSVPGMLAKCGECAAYLRVYKDQAMGEAYSTTCRENPPKPKVDEDAILADQTQTMRSYTLNKWAQVIHQYAIDKGWWDDPTDRNFGDLCTLLHSEISEAYEEYRNHRQMDERYYTIDKHGNKKPEGIPSELIDLLIRAFDLLGYMRVDVEDVLIEKHMYNQSRPYRHGGKVS